MTDQEQIFQLYGQMYRAMIEKDTAVLSALHADDFILIHMTGMRQSKRAYIDAIRNGTLNYYSAVTEGIDIHVDGKVATMTGRSRVEAAVFGGSRHTWPLQICFTLRREGGQWRLTSASASTY